MEWIAAQHALLAHLPVAAGLLLPLALVASLRPGRGIRPWWTACRYLGWAGLLGLIACLASGWILAQRLGLFGPGRWLPAGGGPALMRHLMYAASSLPAGVLALWAMHRKRKEHQGLGVLPLFLGLVWAGLCLATGWTGHRMVHPVLVPVQAAAPAPASPAPPPPKPAPPADPEAKAPFRALDYASLIPVTPMPLRSLVHGGRWIRIWASPEAVDAYRAGTALPEGALVVMSSVEDRWGRPAPDPGPLYALEIKGGQPRLTFYWPQVPLDRREETGGEDRAYWRTPDPHLASCLACHAAGMADPAKRGPWRAPRKAAPLPEVPAPSR